jgi:ABC-type nitrate/sulfonate/bicarbonate transport system substrate-binding protein
MTIKYPTEKAGARLRHQFSVLSLVIGLFVISQSISAADKLIGIHSARVLSQSMPWVATEAGLFKKYNLDFDLVFIASSPSVTAAMFSRRRRRADPRLRSGSFGFRVCRRI